MYFSPEIASAQDYFPFGMVMPGRSLASGDYRFGFNGKEQDPETYGVGNIYDYGFRVYDPRGGRFLSVDPLAPSYPWNSTYAFAENDVIRGGDLDGQEFFEQVLVWGLSKINTQEEVTELLDNTGVGNQVARNTALFFGGAVSVVVPDAEGAAEQQFDKLKRYGSGDVSTFEVAHDISKAIAPTLTDAVDGALHKADQIKAIARGGEDAWFVVGQLTAETSLLAAGAFEAKMASRTPKVSNRAVDRVAGSEFEGPNRMVEQPFARKWTDEAGNINWPSNNGFSGTPKQTTLMPGTRIDRYGYEGGTFVSPEGVPYGARSLAPGTELKPYNVYEVVKPIDVLEGPAAPWFDEVGGGKQYQLNQKVGKLLEDGYLKKISK